jgi:branched-chain amino acid transport system permease protein
MADFRVQHSNWSSRIGTAIMLVALAALAAAPWWADRADLRLLSEIYAYVALASLWNVLAGYAGLVSVVLSIASSRQMREFVIYWIALAQVAVILLGIVWLLRSRYGLALTAIRDNELGARSNGINVARIKFVVYVAVAFGTAMVGALIFLQKIRISPDTAFSVNDWTAFVIFINVIGGIGRIEGPIIGTVVFFVLRQTLADLGAIYLLILGVVAIAVMLKAPKGIWGLIADRFGWQVFPLERRLVTGPR